MRACVRYRHACAGVCQRRMSDIFLVCLEMGSVTELKSLPFCIDCLAQRIPGIHLHLCPPHPPMLGLQVCVVMPGFFTCVLWILIQVLMKHYYPLRISQSFNCSLIKKLALGTRL